MRHHPRLRLLAAILLVASCGEPSAPRTPASIAFVGGSGQSALVATALPQPLVVEVKDAGGRTISGVRVTWTVTDGGGTASSATGTTDGSGRAQVQWTLGTTSGVQRMTAAVNGVAPTAVTAIGNAGPAAGIVIVSGSAQSAVIGTQLSMPLVARATDAHGNGVAGTTVTFAPSAGTVSPASAETNTSGLAITAWTLGGTEGEQTMDATLVATSASTRFTATALPMPVISTIENDIPITGLAAADKVDRIYRITVPANAMRLLVTVNGPSGDADLYVRRGAIPTLQQSDCASTSPTSTETCDIPTPTGGDWYILLHAWSAYTGVTIRAAYSVGGSMALTVQGLPDGTGAGIRVTGPSGYSRTVDATETLGGLGAGTYTLFAPNVLHSGVVYNASPGTQQVTVAGEAQASALIAYAQTSGGLNLDVTGLYITQSVQRPDGSVPLIAGRDGLVRVFARANAVNTASAAVRVRTYHAGTLVDTRTIAAPSGSVPVIVDEGVLNATWNVLLPGSLIQPGMSIIADADPDNTVAESDETDNAYPVNGTPLALTVRTAPVLQARFVPVIQAGNEAADVTAANVDSYITTARAMFPVPSVDADVRAPYTFDKVLPSQYDSIWARLLGQMHALRTADASARYYYGVVKPAYQSGGTGLGYIGAPAALGVEWSNWRAETVAHEWGHNFGRRHVACGNPANPDPNYPYTSRPGETGHHGFDLRSSTLRSRDIHVDLMSYCQPTWVSDYTYEAVMDFRGTATGAAAEPAILIWGQVSREGVRLEPVFTLTTIPTLPQKAGPYRVTGYDANGAEVVSLAFEGVAIDHLPDVRHFAYAVPLRALRGRELARLELTGPSGAAEQRRPAVAAGAGDDVRITRDDASTIRVRWDATQHPALIVRDAATGEILTFARGGDARVVTRANDIELNMSNGVHSGVRRRTVER